jgi:hypothetical protein
VQKRRGEAARRSRRRRKSGNSQWRRVSALTVAGAAIVGLFAVAGYQIGNVAVAHNGAPADFGLGLAAQPDPAPALRKASLIASTPLVAPVEQLPSERPIRASLAAAKSDNLFNTKVAERSDRLYRLVSPPVDLLERSWREGREQRRQVAEQQCLARAIYFEARSESEIGRLAVARVILNRVNSPFYPDSICGVVYQNAEKRDGCQFSFACDGKSDRPRQGAAWKVAKSLAARAIAGEGEVQAIATATHYHADYVLPEWSGAMTRLVKIGRHIFYSGS